MSNMIQFTQALLGAVADFLAAEPVFYLFTVVILCFLAKSSVPANMAARLVIISMKGVDPSDCCFRPVHSAD